MRKRILFVMLLSMHSIGSLLATSAGVLDITFNPLGVQPGTVSTTIDGSPLQAVSNGVAIQADGKIVIVGFLKGDGESFTSKFAVARFNTNGSLDTSFNNTGPQPGTVTTTIDNVLNSSGYDVKIQPVDQKIVVSGLVTDSLGNTKCALARFNVNGTLDTTFNPAPGGIQPGTVSTKISNRFMSNGNTACTLALQANGKIVVTGFFDDAFGLARFNTDGTLDTTTFNPAPGGIQPGTVTTTIDTTGAGSAFDVAIQTNGKIVVSGGINYNLGALARFNSDGSLDTTFNAGGALPGTLTTTIANLNASMYAVALQADGKIVICGESFPFGSFAAIARFNTNGTLDTTFNPNGVQAGTLALPTMNSLPNAFFYWLTIQSNGQIVAGGGVYGPGLAPNLFGVARFNTNGTLDATFNPSGTEPGTATTTVDNTTGEQVWMVALQADGKIVVAGQAAGLNKFAVARFLGAGAITDVCV